MSAHLNGVWARTLHERWAGPGAPTTMKYLKHLEPARFHTKEGERRNIHLMSPTSPRARAQTTGVGPKYLLT